MPLGPGRLGEVSDGLLDADFGLAGEGSWREDGEGELGIGLGEADNVDDAAALRLASLGVGGSTLSPVAVTDFDFGRVGPRAVDAVFPAAFPAAVAFLVASADSASLRKAAKAGLGRRPYDSTRILRCWTRLSSSESNGDRLVDDWILYRS